MAPTQRDKTAKTTAKRTVCSAEDYGILLDYLEDRTNFEKLFGAGRKTTVGGKFLKKGDAWDIAAAELKVEGFKETSGRCLYKKWQRYFAKYREAKIVIEQCGGGLTDDEVEKGLNWEGKLNGICEHFYKMDALMGSRVNANPLALSGPMEFQKFAEPASPKQIQTSQLPEIVNISTVSSTNGHSDGQQLDRSPTPPWMLEPLDQSAQEQQTGGQRGEMETPQPPLQEDTNEGAAGTSIPHAKQGGATVIHEGSTQPLPVAPSVPLSGTTSNGAATSAAAPSLQPQKNKVAAEQGKQKATKGVSSSAPKPSLANAFQETEVRYKYIEKKEHWKMVELKEQRDARFDEYKRRKLELDFQAEQKRLDREAQFLEANRERVHKSEEAERDRFHTAELAKQKNKLDLIISGWCQNKSLDEISHMCSVLDG